MNLDLSQDEIDTAAICALRYAMGRMSYIVGDAADLIRHLWPFASKGVRQVILDELRSTIEKDTSSRAKSNTPFGRTLGMDCDRSVWVRLLADLTATPVGDKP